MVFINIFVWLVGLYLGFFARWFEVVGLGFIFDLVVGGQVGMTSVKLLIGAGLIYLVKQYWPLRQKQQLSLKM